MKGKVNCTCGWSWNKSDSSKKDMYICHECGRDNSNNMKNGGWMDNYNDSKASAPEGMVGDGFSNVGRNYSPAWGGQFKEGGKVDPPRRKVIAESTGVYKKPFNEKELKNIIKDNVEYRRTGTLKKPRAEANKFEKYLPTKETVDFFKNLKNDNTSAVFNEALKIQHERGNPSINVGTDKGLLFANKRNYNPFTNEVNIPKSEYRGNINNYIQEVSHAGQPLSEVIPRFLTNDIPGYIKAYTSEGDIHHNIHKYVYNNPNTVENYTHKKIQPELSKRIHRVYSFPMTKEEEEEELDLILKYDLDKKQMGGNVYPVNYVPQAQEGIKTYSYPLRDKLYPGEEEYFKAHPHVGGMAAEDNQVIINPYSPLSDEEKNAIRMNETARLAMRGGYQRPTFELTPEQQEAFKDYSSDEQDIRETIIGRILSGDPSAKNVTPEQKKYAEELQKVLKFKDGGYLKKQAKKTEKDLLKKYVDPSTKRALERAKQQGINTGIHNGPLDAIRHSSSAAAMSSALPTWTNFIPGVAPLKIAATNVAGIAHELNAPNSLKEHASDLYNNFIGSVVGVLPISEENQHDLLIQAQKNNVLSDMGNRTPLRNKKLVVPNLPSLPKKAMGGSIPGAVGFTYARTKGIPSNGPYAKKTMASAQNGVDMYGAPITAVEKHDVNLNRSHYNPRTNVMTLGNDYNVWYDYNGKRLEGEELKNHQNELIAHENRHAWQFDNDRSNFDIAHHTDQEQWARMQKKPQMMTSDNVWNSYHNRSGIEAAMDIDNVIPFIPETKIIPEQVSRDKIFQKIVDPQRYRNPNSLEGEASYYEYTGYDPDEKAKLASPKFQNGGEMRYYQHGLDFKTKGMKDGGWLDRYDKAQDGYTTGDKVKYGTPEYREAYNRGEVITDEGVRSPIALDEVVIQNNYRRPRGFWEQYADKIAEENKDAGVLGAIIGTPISAVTSLPQLAMMKGLTGEMQRPSEAMDIENPYGAFAVDAVTDLTNLVGAGILTKEEVLAKLGDLRNVNAEGKIFSGMNNELNNMAIQNTERYMAKRTPSTSTLSPEMEPYVSRYTKLSDEPYIPYQEDEYIKWFNEQKAKMNPPVVKQDPRSILRRSSVIDINDVEPTKFNFIKQDLSEGNNIKYSFTNEQGNNIATFSGRKSPEGIYVNSIEVNPEFRRQGVASDIYKNIAKELQSKNEGTLFSRSGQHQFTDRDELGRSIAPANKLWENLVNKGEAEKFVEGMSHTYKINPLKQGGIIKDDRGQWDHPGEITEIGSNQITMQGVPYPVLGISDTGDTKLMKPGKNYKFKGKKVTEFPMAKNGLRQEQKSLQNLDNLLNFTNYNKPQPGGWLSKYE